MFDWGRFLLAASLGPEEKSVEGARHGIAVAGQLV